MKVRNAFVSNSSTQSFIIYGTISDDEQFAKALVNSESLVRDKLTEEVQNANTDIRHKLAKERLDDFEELVRRYKNNEDVEHYDFAELFMEVMERISNMECHTPMDSDTYVGADPRTMKDNETKYQWKTRVEDELLKLGLINNRKECEWHEECWRDG